MNTRAMQPGYASQARMRAAQYLGEMAVECARIARANHLDALGFIFDMAGVEAANVTDDRRRSERGA